MKAGQWDGLRTFRNIYLWTARLLAPRTQIQLAYWCGTRISIRRALGPRAQELFYLDRALQPYSPTALQLCIQLLSCTRTAPDGGYIGYAINAAKCVNAESRLEGDATAAAFSVLYVVLLLTAAAVVSTSYSTSCAVRALLIRVFSS